MRDYNFHVNWRNNIVVVLGLYRVMDKAIRERIITGKIYICQRLFTTDFTRT